MKSETDQDMSVAQELNVGDKTDKDRFASSIYLMSLS